MNDRWFLLTPLFISVGIRGSSCFRISLYPSPGDRMHVDQNALKSRLDGADARTKNKVLGRCRAIERHCVTQTLDPVSKPDLNWNLYHRNGTLAHRENLEQRQIQGRNWLHKLPSQNGFTEPAENLRSLWRGRLQPGNAFGSLERIQRRASHPNFGRRWILRIQRREAPTTRKHTCSPSHPHLKRKRCRRWERS